MIYDNYDFVTIFIFWTVRVLYPETPVSDTSYGLSETEVLGYSTLKHTHIPKMNLRILKINWISLLTSYR